MEQNGRVFVKGKGEMIPVLLRCSRLKNLTRTVSGEEKLYFKPDSNVYAVLAYFKSTVKSRNTEESYYVVTDRGHVLNNGNGLDQVFEQNRGKDGLLHLEVCTYSAF
jgi:hypothetical protein